MFTIYSINYIFKNLSIFIWENFTTIPRSLWPSNVIKCQKIITENMCYLISAQEAGRRGISITTFKNTPMCALIMPISSDWLSQLPIFKSFHLMVEHILPIRFDLQKKLTYFMLYHFKEMKGKSEFWFRMNLWSQARDLNLCH